MSDGRQARTPVRRARGWSGEHRIGIRQDITLESGRTRRAKGSHRIDLLALGDENKEEAVKQKIMALRALAKQQLNAPARNYYLSTAMELEKK